MDRVTSIIFAAAAVAIAAILTMAPEPGRYSYKMTDNEVRRFDSATGEVRVCPKGDDCFTFEWR